MSLQTNGLEYAMGITGMRNVFSLSEAEMKAWLKKHRGGGFLSCPEYFLRHYRLTNKFFRGRPCFILNPRVSTGHEIGGVCPFGVKPDVRVYLDESLKRFDRVYPACGSANSAIGLTIPELEKCSGFLSWIDVCKTRA